MLQPSDEIFRVEEAMRLVHPVFGPLESPDYVRLGLPRRLDFSSPSLVARLSELLFLHFFGLSVCLDPLRLVPTVPLRYHYLLWVRSLPGVPSNSLMLDIGTGASAVMALLASSAWGWRCVGSDTDAAARDSARAVCAANARGAGARVRVVAAPPSGFFPPPPPEFGTLSSYDVSVCNPPFYASRAEVPPTCGGIDAELCTEGGESAFLAAMVAEADDTFAPPAGRWMTALLGHYRTRDEIAALLGRRFGSFEWRSTVLAPNESKTRRLALAWRRTWGERG